MFKNNIFSNPVGWAEKAVGTKIRFFYVMISTLVLGTLIILMLYLEMENFKTWIIFSIMIIVATIVPSMIYLLGLRKLLIKLKELKENDR